MRAKSRLAIAIYIFIAALFSLLSTRGATLEEIRGTENLTPQKFARFFSDFDFKFRARVQTPEVFLATESGDCDDYSTLAAMILREKGYTPRLITVRMPKVVHVVCYIEETQSYLDYNSRGYFRKMIKCGPGMDEIARKVARSYGAEWSSASEFLFDSGVKRLVATIQPKPAEAAVSSTLAKVVR